VGVRTARHCNGKRTPSIATGPRAAAGKAGGVGGPKSGDDPAPSARDVPRGRGGRRELAFAAPGASAGCSRGFFVRRARVKRAQVHLYYGRRQGQVHRRLRQPSAPGGGGWRVLFVQFLKDARDPSSEVEAAVGARSPLPPACARTAGLRDRRPGPAGAPAAAHGLRRADGARPRRAGAASPRRRRAPTRRSSPATSGCSPPPTSVAPVRLAGGRVRAPGDLNRPLGAAGAAARCGPGDELVKSGTRSTREPSPSMASTTSRTPTRAVCGVGLRPSSPRRIARTPHSSGLVRLASGLFLGAPATRFFRGGRGKRHGSCPLRPRRSSSSSSRGGGGAGVGVGGNGARRRSAAGRGAGRAAAHRVARAEHHRDALRARLATASPA